MCKLLLTFLYCCLPTTYSKFFFFFFQIFNLFPFIKHFPGPHQKIYQNAEELKGFIREAVQEHRETLDPDNPRDFIDAYLLEIEKVRYHHDNPLQKLYSLVFDGTVSSLDLERHFEVLYKQLFKFELGKFEMRFFINCFAWSSKSPMMTPHFMRRTW